jgi:hypothetical protein
MKHLTLLRLLTAAGSALSTLAVIDLSGIAQFLDPEQAKWFLVAGPAALALKEFFVVLDDGKPNKSSKFRMLPVVLVLLTMPLLSSCTTPPPVNGTFATKAGRITVTPDGRFEIVIEPRSGK